MSEELLQNDLIKNPPKIGIWNYYSIGSTNLNALKKHKIIPNINYGKFWRRKPDGLITYNQKIIALIENKVPSEFNTIAKQQKAINQGLDVANILSSKILIATDTIRTIWVNATNGERILEESGSELSINFSPSNPEVPKLIEKILKSINSNNSKIIPEKLINPSPLAKQIWQDIWSVSGATPENCLYTFVELFIFKYLSDLNVLTGMYSFNSLMDQYKKNTEKEVLEFYADIIRKRIKTLFPKNLQDNTTVINGTIFVSKDDKAIAGYSSVFKKILEKFKKEGKLENIHHDFKSKVFESFLKESISKKNWGQYFTPLKVVRAIIKMVEIKEGMEICDPACGVGKFLLEPILEDIDRFYKVKDNNLDIKIKLNGFDKGFDKDEQKTIILAKANMLIYFSDMIRRYPGITVEFAKLFNETFTLKTNSILGSLSDPIKEKYHLILTNPPYVMSGSSNLKEEIKKSGLDSHFVINSLGVEGLFVEWIIRALKKDGKAIVVIPDSILIRQHDKMLREFILDECFVNAIISLPLNTFFTTNKKTNIIVLTKKNEKMIKQSDPIFTYLVSEIGETLDINRFEIEENHLNDAVVLYNQFKGAPNYFKTVDKRCKIIPFKEFLKNVEAGWFIDSWWSEKDKIELGVVKEEESVSLDEFAMMIQDMSTTLAEYQLQLSDIAPQKKNSIKFKNIGVTDYFDTKLGQPKYTKTFCNSNAGEYPVHSASNNQPIGFINSFDYEGQHLSWARNGFAGYLKYHNEKFSINYDRGILIPKNDKINLFYVKQALEPELRKIAQGRKGEKGKDEFTKVYLSMVRNCNIPFPLNEKNEISSVYQNAIVESSMLEEQVKAEIKLYIDRIKKAKIDFLEHIDETFKEINITSIFNIAKGKSIYTKKYIHENQGPFPVFSSQTKDDGILGFIDTPDFDVDCLTWTTDGVHA
ncbi:N-6 DNA methylase [bacterium]|nr:N-6 DNA methylase [bacterium]